MDKRVIQIEDIEIRYKRVTQQGDTINYLVNSFVSSGDKSIGDVLKRLPGIDVNSNGIIKYNGRAINRFYIEGADMLNGLYGVAVKILSPNDIGMVQVLENHQPLKILEDFEQSDRAAINLRLKETSKATWIKGAELFAGVPHLWKSKAMAMRVTPEIQLLGLYKSNNIGENIVNENNVITLENLLDGDFIKSESSSTIGLSLPIPAGIAERRSLFNNSHLVSINELQHLRNGVEVRANVQYAYEKVSSSCANTHIYYLLPDSSLVVHEGEGGIKRENILGSEVALKRNCDRLFLENKLRFDMKNSAIELNALHNNRYAQIAQSNNRDLTNNLNLIARRGNKLFKFRSYTTIKQNKQSLNVRINSQNSAVQTLSQRQIFKNSAVSTSLIRNCWKFSADIGLRFESNKLTSELDHELIHYQ